MLLSPIDFLELFCRSPKHFAIIGLDPTEEVHIASSKTTELAHLNDQFRRGDPSVPGQGFVTAGVVHLLKQQEIPTETLIQRVAHFDDFSEQNNPHAQHDFGAFELHGHQLLWKADAYDLDCHKGSNVLNDHSKTRRVLTIMLA